MQERSGLFQAGKVLLLVGAIIAAVGALFLVLLAFGMEFLFSAVGEDAREAAWIPIFYHVLAALMGVGAVFGFLAFGKAGRGDVQGAFVFGLVAALVPPVQIIPLLGAIFCKVSPEAAQSP